jgi:hypothetical protein
MPVDKGEREHARDGRAMEPVVQHEPFCHVAISHINEDSGPHQTPFGELSQ